MYYYTDKDIIQIRIQLSKCFTYERPRRKAIAAAKWDMTVDKIESNTNIISLFLYGSVGYWIIAHWLSHEHYSLI